MPVSQFGELLILIILTWFYMAVSIIRVNFPLPPHYVQMSYLIELELRLPHNPPQDDLEQYTCSAEDIQLLRVESC